jgi:serine protease Do
MTKRTLMAAGVLAANLFTAQALAQKVETEKEKDKNKPRASTARGVVVQKAGTSYLGIGVAEIDSERAKELKLSEERGVEVKNVDGDGPAAKAGLKEGDVVLEYNGQRVEGTEQFIRMVRETPAGRQARLLVSRGGGTQTLTATIGTRMSHLVAAGPDGFRFAVPVPPAPPVPPNMGERWWREMPDLPSGNMSWRSGTLGIESESLAPQLAQFFGVKEGVLVRSVNKNSPAEKAGVKAGDVITKVNSTAVDSPRDISSELRSARGKGSVTLTVMRNQKEMTLTVTLEDAPGGFNNRIRAAMYWHC